jgi:tRNA-specific 2-thiouridylase
MSSPSRAPLAAPAPEVVVGLSGGVDSAVALALLARAGVAVAALYMKNWDEDDDDARCPAAEDLEMATRVCEQLGVALRTVNFSYEYWERVFTRFLDEHRAGRTPNPDVLCNSEVKFDAFLGLALDMGAQRIATGHYARVRARGGRQALLKGRDPTKDQSYFLHTLSQAQLAYTRFPLGDLAKREVRAIAAELGLAPHARKDSTGICFIGERPFRAFLSRWLEPRLGPIVSVDGERLGEHTGLAFHTIGQRHGLAIGGHRGGTGEPWYVARKESATDTLVVAQGRHHPALHARLLVTEPAHWVAGAAPALPLRCAAKIRYRQPEAACTVTALAGGCCEVRFDRPQWAVAPGQSVVLYGGDECLGGAVIEAAA